MKARQARLALTDGYGEVYDLRELFNELNREYFDRRVCAFVNWSRARSCGPRRIRDTVLLGAYCYDDVTIRIHPCLDQRFIPRFFISYVMYHEMLHQLHPPVLDARGRRHFHTPAFKQDERQYRHYTKALRWEDKNLDRLLRFRG